MNSKIFETIYNMKIGERYGKLTIVGLPFRARKFENHVVAKCDCGNKRIVRCLSIKKGKSRSCGCVNNELSDDIKSKFYPGNLVGYFTILGNPFFAYTGPKIVRRSLVVVRCICGKVDIKETRVINSKNSLSCGCAKLRPLCKSNIEEIDDSSIRAKVRNGWLMLDKKDFEHLKNISCYISQGYPFATINGQKKSLGRIILSCPEGFDIDHIDRNPLNNKRSNLRIVTRTQNLLNKKSSGGTSKYKGVYKEKKGREKIYRSYFAGKTIGHFYTEVEAAIARDNFCRKLKNKDYMRYNFPLEGERSALE